MVAGTRQIPDNIWTPPHVKYQTTHGRRHTSNTRQHMDAARVIYNVLHSRDHPP